MPRCSPDLVGADALNQENAGREAGGRLVPHRDLGLAHDVVDDRVLAEHQLPGDQRSQQTEPRG
jgi:hypothetical protein